MLEAEQKRKPGRPRGTWCKYEDLFSTDCKHSQYAVKTVIRRDKLIPYCCAGIKGRTCVLTIACPLEDFPDGPIWNGEPVVLVLDHVDGNTNNNRLDNFRFLCPNCNSQTDTFAGRNIKKGRKERYEYPCRMGCGRMLRKKGGRCRPCAIAVGEFGTMKRNRVDSGAGAVGSPLWL